MKKKNKYGNRVVLVLMLLLLALVGWSLPVQAAQDAEVQVMIDSQPLKADVAPKIINGRTMVPLRAIFEALGLRLDWYPATGIIKASKANADITLQVGQQQAVVNNRSVFLETPATVVNGRTLVPVRFISESIGMLVEWDAGRQIVWIGQAPAKIETASTPELVKEGEKTAETVGKDSYTTKILSEDTELPYREGRKALSLW